ncbi:hypothetical protein, partial [Amycolatopsis sp. NPDC057786]|uniref:hypothetical protein n=1 Tax=Amycolatopsis sp. NPDC057786 TaxID=3346250 RepID=UPI00366E1511
MKCRVARDIRVSTRRCAVVVGGIGDGVKAPFAASDAVMGAFGPGRGRGDVVKGPFETMKVSKGP